MTRLLLAVVLAGLFSPCSLAQEKWRIEPGRVLAGNEIPGLLRGAASSGLQVTGSLTLVRDDAMGIASTRRGGACLVADLSRRSCAVDRDCNPVVLPRRVAGGRPDVPRFLLEQHPDKFGYCLDQRCWVRPGSAPDYCKTGLLLVEGEQVQLPVVPAKVDGRDASHRWLVHACLNPSPAPVPPAKPPCAEINDDTETTYNGPVRRVP